MKLSLQTKYFTEQLDRGLFDNALRLANDFSLKEPDSPEGYSMLGDALMHKGEHEKATNCYRLSLIKDPGQPDIYTALGKAYLLIGEIGLAYENYYNAMCLAPDDADVLQKTGNFLILVGRVNDATVVLEKAVSLGAKNAIKSLLNLKIHLGDKKELNSFMLDNKKLLLKDRLDLTVVRAQYTLGEYTKVIEILSKVNTDKINYSAKSACFHLMAASYEQLGNFKTAFKYYNKQNNSKKIIYAKDKIEKTIDSIISNSEKMDVSTVQYKSVTDQEFSPLFIIGLPRSGTSLLAQVLNTSDHVVAGGELLFVEAAYKKYFENKQPLDQVSAWYREKIEFITKNQEIPKTAPRWLTDKLPANFVNIGFIKNMIPDAKFIYCKRNPMDNGLSIYKQDFLNVHSYATKLEDIAHFVSLERKVMKYWSSRYSDDIHTVEYDNLVTDFDVETQQIFNHCDLSWNEDVKSFYTNKHYCHTASFDQVRQPVHTNSVGFNKKYTAELDKLHLELIRYGVI